jgi:hypothetical protein
MRYLTLNMILASALLSTLACGDSGGAEAEETGTSTAGETATGDGDGDPGDGDPGDGDPGDGDPGDGDGDPGDGDGEPGDGDGEPGDGDGEPGDGDGEPGDGDGDAGCVPLGNTQCDACTAENCCDEIMACQADQDCTCLSDCVAMNVEPQMCLQMCNIDPNGLMNPQLLALRECRNAECMQECMMP